MNKIDPRTLKVAHKLSSSKVDLKLADKLQDISVEVETYLSDAIKEANEVEKMFKKVKDRNDTRSSNAEKEREKAFKVMREIKEAYKTLGEPIPDRYVSAYNRISEMARKIPTTNLGGVFPL